MHRLLLPVFGCALISAGCTEVITEPGVPVAIEIGPLPYPSVIAGDSLRDTTGVAVPVPVRVFDGRGELIEGATVNFLVIGADPPGAVDPATGHLVGLTPGTIRVVAQSGGLQSAILTVPVVLRPTTLQPVTALRDTLQYRDFRDHERELRVRVLADTGQPPAGIGNYVVDFRIVQPPGLDPADSTVVYLVNEQRRASTRDTTAADGAAARRVRLAPWIQRPPPDSVVVEVRARHLDGTPIAGSPQRFVVEVVPAP